MGVGLGAGSSEAAAGAGALVVKAKRSWVVLWTLALADLRARYGRGRIRLVKWLFDPFAAAGVYLLLVTLILDEPGTAPGLSIACAVVAFQIVLMTMVSAMDAYNSRSTIVLNMGFPRMLIPPASALAESIAFAGSLGLLVLMMAIYGVGL